VNPLQDEPFNAPEGFSLGWSGPDGPSPPSLVRGAVAEALSPSTSSGQTSPRARRRSLSLSNGSKPARP